MNKSLKKSALKRTMILLVTFASLSGCESLTTQAQTKCVATDPVLSELSSYSNVQVAVVDADTLKVVSSLFVPKATSVTLIFEPDLAELARYMEELRQCVATNF